MDVHGQALVLAAPCVLLFGALLQLAVAPLRSARIKGILAAASSLPAALLVLLLIPSIHAGQVIDFNLFSWDGPLMLAVHVDGLGLLFALMGTGLGTIVLLYSVAYMEHDRAATRFYAAMLVFIGGFVALVWSANLILLYLFWEVIGLCSFSLVGFWYTDREAVAGARKVLLMTHLAGYGLLAAILILYHRAGTVLWTDPAVTRNFTAVVFVLMLIAVVAKSVQVPLHTWIPDAMAAPTPVSSLLHAACYVTAGVYLAARMHSFGIWPHLWGSSLVWIGCVTMVVGVMYAMVQTDLKRMLAFSTVSQIGYMIMALGIGTSLAIIAGLLHCLNHGFFKGGLFLNAGAVQHATGTRDMNRLGGLAQRMPRTTLAWLVGVGSMAGIPLLSGFVSKWMLYAAALEAGWIVPALVAWIVSLGTVFLCAKATSSVFLGTPTADTENAHEAPLAMRWAMGLMAAGNIVLGIAPQLAVNFLLLPVVSSFALSSSLQVTWFGLFTGTGSFSTTGGLVLAVVSLVMGGVIYAFAYALRPAQVAVASGP
ncbi:MAG TPA: NADH-quinone oxidoreductase subunit L, partial [Acidobacteriaceae bacterium]|nr:NADH-quinone oxidoreductase subunit L [Acidobacteriaceae bacterium]